MAFFDLNIPYHESDRHVTDKSSLKSRRLKLALKAMELGFTGVAYNRTIKGVMSESDRCSTSHFPLTKLAASSSSAFVAAVKFHRQLLNVAVSSPFRQYTRLTVIVDTPAQASALNSGNPILRSYDIVAVRPMNQSAFDQACQTSEVDMIAVDFSDKLPFRLKQPMVKAAIKRGVYFEITYTGLIADAQSRRQVISNCKLLVDWTRGQNLIICSAAPSVSELRGPQDVANLFSLLGLPMERANTAISKNCRSLLANALRKRQFYKETVKIERIPSGGQVNTEQDTVDDWLKWDPISSAEGDLLLDDMEKSFAISNGLKETKKTVDFTSSLNGLPAHGLQIKDLLSVTNKSLESSLNDNSIPTAMEIDEAAAVERAVVPADLNPLHENESSLGTLSKVQGSTMEFDCQDFKFSFGDVLEDQATLLPLQEEVQTRVSNANIGHDASAVEESAMSSLPPPEGTKTISEQTLSISIKTPNNSVDLIKKLVASENESHGSPSLVCGENVLHGDCISAPEGVALERVPNKVDREKEKQIPLAPSDTSSQDAYSREQCEMINEGSLNLRKNSKELIFHEVMGDRNGVEVISNYQGSGKLKAGKGRRKQNSPPKPFLYPFKRFLSPKASKKKSRKLKKPRSSR